MENLSFFYGGFGKRDGLNGNTIDEHELLRGTVERYPGHQIHLYELSDIRGGEIFHDGKYTTESGWDDKEEEVMYRYMQLARYMNINTMSFTVYGGVAKDGKGRLVMTEPMGNYVNYANSHFPDMRFTPMICMALPRLDLPVQVPLSNNNESYRFEMISIQSFEFMIKALLEDYYAEYTDKFYKINDRPVFFLFDMVRIGIDDRFGINRQEVARSISRLRNYSVLNFNTNPLFIGIVNNLRHAKEATGTGVDYVSNYIDLPYFHKAHDWPVQDYEDLIEIRMQEWSQIDQEANLPFIPALVSGFDASARVHPSSEGKVIRRQAYDKSKSYYPLIPHVPNTEDRAVQYKRYLQAGKKRSLDRQLPILNLGPLNELTEQCALLPYYTRDDQDRKIDLIEEVRNITKVYNDNEEA